MNFAHTTTREALRCSLSERSPEQLASDPHVLAIIVHGLVADGLTVDGLTADSLDERAPESPKMVRTGMRRLFPPTAVEVWTTDAVVETLESGNIRMAKTPDLLLASCSIEESGSLEEDSRKAYDLLLTTIRNQGYPALLRTWNYMADINHGEGDNERYKQFCSGRFMAFTAHGVSERGYPAASALGHQGNRLVIYALSARLPGIHIENPNQQSAYNYPKIYGPKSPSFARATVSPVLGQTFVSGTASITGHETLHADDVGKQLELTLSNIRRLAAHIESTQNLTLACDLFKVYIRDPANLAAIRSLLGELFPGLPCLYLQADVCRSDLLLEIEAVYSHL